MFAFMQSNCIVVSRMYSSVTEITQIVDKLSPCQQLGFPWSEENVSLNKILISLIKYILLRLRFSLNWSKLCHWQGESLSTTKLIAAIRENNPTYIEQSKIRNLHLKTILIETSFCSSA